MTNTSTDEVLVRGCANLRRGRFDVGWAQYEARFAGKGSARPLPQPLWRGESLEGKTILVQREQGVGDEIMFASCFPDLINRCTHCILTCDSRLEALFRRSFPTCSVIAGRPNEDDWPRLRRLQVDYQVPAGNVPRYLRSDISMFPSTRRFLLVDRHAQEAWRARFDQLGDALKIGISWQGGRDLLSLRQAPWDVWREVLIVEGVQFVNLQYGTPSNVLRTIRRKWGVEVHHWDELDLLNDLDGLAAQIAALDLVITVPNTTVHLAGSLGVPLWILFTQEWGCFWILNGVETPWYPSAKVFPTLDGRGWTPVVEQMRDRLAKLVIAKARRPEPAAPYPRVMAGPGS